MNLAHTSDTLDSLRDAIMIRAGIMAPSAHSVHPLALRHIDTNENLLKALAAYCGELMPRATSTAVGALSSGMGTSDFKAVLADTLRRVSVHRFRKNANHRRLCLPVEVPNYQNIEFPGLDIDFSLDETDEGGALSGYASMTFVPGISARVKTYGKNVFISRTLIINDDIELVSKCFENIGGAAARREANLIYSMIESNPTLGDGQPMFHPDHGNVEAAILSSDALGAAMAKLRLMKIATGAMADVDAAFLVVAPDIELVARRLLHESGIDPQAIIVIATSELPLGRWYLMASPERAPTVGLISLKGSNVGFFVGEPRAKKNVDGIVLGARFDVGVVALSRVGILKGGL